VSRALLVRRVDYGESDLVVTLFTEGLGKVSALARGARRSARRFGGALEPMHTLCVRLDERPSSELLTLSEAKIDTPRSRLLERLSTLEAAGRALGWVRRASPPRTPEPHVWRVLDVLLDRLNEADADVVARSLLARAGLELLAAFGWGLDLDACVSCGKPCPEGTSALVDVGRGGLVCRSCGGARLRLTAETRLRLSGASRGRVVELPPEDAEVALDLVDRGMRAHMGFE
jgi:DNA repair protein RecO (recombination protein O)